MGFGYWFSKFTSSEGLFYFSVVTFVILFLWMVFGPNPQEDVKKSTKTNKNSTTSTSTKQEELQTPLLSTKRFKATVLPEEAQQKVPPKQRKNITVPTKFGAFQVHVVGDPSSRCKLVTVHDVAVTFRSCFGNFFQVGVGNRYLEKFCVYHISAPGHWEGENCSIDDDIFPSMSEFGEALDTVLRILKIGRFVGLGVGAGSSALLQYVLLERRRKSQASKSPAGASCQGLILLGVDSRSADSSERAGSYLLMKAIESNMLSEAVRNAFAGRLFSRKALSGRFSVVDSYLEDLATINLKFCVKYLQAYVSRPPLKNEDLKLLGELPMLLAYGAPSCAGGSWPLGLLLQQPGMAQAQEFIARINRTSPANASLSSLELPNSGVLGTQEQPRLLIKPIEMFLEGIGYWF